MQSVVNSVHKGVDRVTDVVNRTWEYKNAHPHAFAAAIIASSRTYLTGNIIIFLNCFLNFFGFDFANEDISSPRKVGDQACPTLCQEQHHFGTYFRLFSRIY